MTPNEIAMLVSGIAFGVQAMNILNAYWARQDDRRSAAQARAALKRAVGDRYLTSFRRYQLQQLKQRSRA